MLIRTFIAAFGLLPVTAAGQSDATFQTWLDTARTDNDIPGLSAAVVVDREIRFVGGSGFADIARRRPMTAETPLYIGSVSKVLTAVLVLNLIEGGQLSLDQSVALIADSPTDNPVRVEHLLAHSSGLLREGNFGYWFSADFPNRESLTEWLQSTTLRARPGATLHYSNTGYAALGLIIEGVLEVSFEKAINDRVFAPLGMQNSGARGPARDVSNGYTPRGQILPSAARPFAGVGPAIAGRHERQYHDAQAMSPAFGAWSSASDMARLLAFLVGHNDEDLLSVEMRARMRERQSTGRGLGFRLGQVAGQPIVRHDGWFAAHRTHLLLDGERGIGVVVLGNSDNTPARELADDLYRLVLDPVR